MCASALSSNTNLLRLMDVRAVDRCQGDQCASGSSCVCLGDHSFGLVSLLLLCVCRKRGLCVFCVDVHHTHTDTHTDTRTHTHAHTHTHTHTHRHTHTHTHIAVLCAFPFVMVARQVPV